MLVEPSQTCTILIVDAWMLSTAESLSTNLVVPPWAKNSANVHSSLSFEETDKFGLTTNVHPNSK
jgi:hypothetical protein